MKRMLSKIRHSMQRSKSSMPDLVASAATARKSNDTPSPKDIPESLLPSLMPASSSSVEPVRNSATLERLPPEVRRLLLSMLELDELSALVHASAIFHQQYLLDRRFLLCKCLETTLRSITVDACTVYQAGLADFSRTRTREKITQFLKSYDGQRSSTRYSIFVESLTEDEAVAVVAFHSSVVKPLVRQYTDWALINLADVTKNSQSNTLSKTEETRLLRGLYRFQLCCNLFGADTHRRYIEPMFTIESVDILKAFFCLFEPWEVEEIACIYTFSKDKYDEIFHNIYWDVHPKNPKFDDQGRPPTPDGAFNLDESWTRERLLVGTISCGIEALHFVLSIKDHALLVSAMQEHISWPRGHFLEDEALGDTAQSMRRRERLSDQDQKEKRRDPLPFGGDRELYPPLAWTLIWRGTYSNLYGYYVEDTIRRWGYIMWDAERLEYAGAKEVLAQQWESSWGNSDPRDD